MRSRVTKRSRKHDPGAHQCCQSARDCVDNQDRALPVRGRRRSSASAEDVMPGTRQKRPRTLYDGRKDWHEITYQEWREGCGPDGNRNSHYYRAQEQGIRARPSGSSPPRQ